MCLTLRTLLVTEIGDKFLTFLLTIFSASRLARAAASIHQRCPKAIWGSVAAASETSRLGSWDWNMVTYVTSWLSSQALLLLEVQPWTLHVDPMALTCLRKELVRPNSIVTSKLSMFSTQASCVWRMWYSCRAHLLRCYVVSWIDHRLMTMRMQRGFVCLLYIYIFALCSNHDKQLIWINLLYLQAQYFAVSCVHGHSPGHITFWYVWIFFHVTWHHRFGYFAVWSPKNNMCVCVRYHTFQLHTHPNLHKCPLNAL